MVQNTGVIIIISSTPLKFVEIKVQYFGHIYTMHYEEGKRDK